MATIPDPDKTKPYSEQTTSPDTRPGHEEDDPLNPKKEDQPQQGQTVPQPQSEAERLRLQRQAEEQKRLAEEAAKRRTER